MSRKADRKRKADRRSGRDDRTHTSDSRRHPSERSKRRGRRGTGSGDASAGRRPRRATWVLLGIGVALSAVGGLIGWQQLQKPPSVVTPIRPAELEPDLTALVRRHVDAVKVAPGRADDHATLGFVYEANEMWYEAYRSFRNAAQLAPEEPLWAYHAATTQREAGNSSGALSALGQVVSRFPGFAPAQHRMGLWLAETGALDQAAQLFQEVLRARPNAQQGLVGLANVKLQLGQHAEAARLLERALRLDTSYKRAHFLLGSAYRRMGRTEDAKRELVLGVDAGTRYFPDGTAQRIRQFMTGLAVKFTEAENLAKAGRPAEAATLLENALARHPNDTNIMNNLAVSYLSMGQKQKALNLLRRAEDINERGFATYINLVECLLAMGRAQDALPCAMRAAELAPNLGAAQFAKARALMALRKYDSAIEALQATLRLDTRNPDVIIAMGEVYVRLGRHVEAKESFQEAARRLPKNLSVHINVCAMCMVLEQFDEAADALAAARRISPDHPRVLAIQTQLAEIRK